MSFPGGQLEVKAIRKVNGCQEHDEYLSLWCARYTQVALLIVLLLVLACLLYLNDRRMIMLVTPLCL